MSGFSKFCFFEHFFLLNRRYYCYFVLSRISPFLVNQCANKLISRTILRLNFLFLSCKIVSGINLSAHQNVFEVTIPLTYPRIRLHRYKSLSAARRKNTIAMQVQQDFSMMRHTVVNAFIRCAENHRCFLLYSTNYQLDLWIIPLYN